MDLSTSLMQFFSLHYLVSRVVAAKSKSLVRPNESNPLTPWDPIPKIALPPDSSSSVTIYVNISDGSTEYGLKLVPIAIRSVFTATAGINAHELRIKGSCANQQESKPLLSERTANPIKSCAFPI